MIGSSYRGCPRSLPCLAADRIAAPQDGLIRPGAPCTCSDSPGLEQIGAFSSTDSRNLCVYFKRHQLKARLFSLVYYIYEKDVYIQIAVHDLRSFPDLLLPEATAPTDRLASELIYPRRLGTLPRPTSQSGADLTIAKQQKPRFPEIVQIDPEMLLHSTVIRAIVLLFVISEVFPLGPFRIPACMPRL